MTRRRERGATLILVVVGLLALIAMAGLALDTAHVLLNKSRLQSALDAAALSGAKALDQSTSTATATLLANSVFSANLSKYPELQNAVSGGLALVTEYSATLNPFSPGTLPAKFVRTSVTGFATQMSLISVLGISSINVAGNAVAGPSPPIVSACNVVPVFMCANPANPPLYGYQIDQVVGLNQVTGSTSAIGPGNYGLLSLGGNGGKHRAQQSCRLLFQLRLDGPQCADGAGCCRGSGLAGHQYTVQRLQGRSVSRHLPARRHQHRRSPDVPDDGWKWKHQAG